MNVSIVGSRTYPHLDAVVSWVEVLAQKYPEAVVISGGARGVDETAEAAAGAFGLGWVVFEPVELTTGGYGIYTRTPRDRLGSRFNKEVFKTYGQAAFYRNGIIVTAGTRVVAFWDLQSNGTADAIAKAAGKKPLWVYGPDGTLNDQYSVPHVPAS